MNTANVLVGLGLIALSGFVERPPGQKIERPSMASLRASFRQAGRPQPIELTKGFWAEITNIMTEEFVHGRSGPEHVKFDIDGIKRQDQAGHAFDWTVAFRDVAGGLQATFESSWTLVGNRADTAAAHFNATGDLVFEKEYGGEGQWIYRCRAVNAERLVCLLLNHESGHGVEFLRIAP